jgi:hypothetical protein
LTLAMACFWGVSVVDKGLIVNLAVLILRSVFLKLDKSEDVVLYVLMDI